MVQNTQVGCLYVQLLTHYINDYILPTTKCINCIIIDHAHPTMVAGHPFKGGWVQSIGQLYHPEMKRFAIGTPLLFLPTYPGKNPYDQIQKPQIPSFNDFFSSYFGKYISKLNIIIHLHVKNGTTDLHICK